MSWTQSYKGTHPIGRYRSKVGTKCGPVFLFNQERTGPDDTWWQNMSLTQSYKGTHPIGRYRSKIGTKCDPVFLFKQERTIPDATWWRNTSLTRTQRTPALFGITNRNQKTFAAKDRSLPNAHLKDLTCDQNRSVAFKNAYRYHSFHGWLE